MLDGSKVFAVAEDIRSEFWHLMLLEFDFCSISEF